MKPKVCLDCQAGIHAACTVCECCRPAVLAPNPEVGDEA